MALKLTRTERILLREVALELAVIGEDLYAAKTVHEAMTAIEKLRAATERVT